MACHQAATLVFYRFCCPCVWECVCVLGLGVFILLFIVIVHCLLIVCAVRSGWLRDARHLPGSAPRGLPVCVPPSPPGCLPHAHREFTSPDTTFMASHTGFPLLTQTTTVQCVCVCVDRIAWRPCVRAGSGCRSWPHVSPFTCTTQPAISRWGGKSYQMQLSMLALLADSLNDHYPLPHYLTLPLTNSVLGSHQQVVSCLISPLMLLHKVLQETVVHNLQSGYFTFSAADFKGLPFALQFFYDARHLETDLDSYLDWLDSLPLRAPVKTRDPEVMTSHFRVSHIIL